MEQERHIISIQYDNNHMFDIVLGAGTTFLKYEMYPTEGGSIYFIGRGDNNRTAYDTPEEFMSSVTDMFYREFEKARKEEKNKGATTL